MGKYKIILATRVRTQLLNHISFLSKASPPAGRRLQKSFADIKERLEENPFQFPIDPVFAELQLPYWKALFGGRYKALFMVEGYEVFVDSVIDCRQNPT